MTARAQSLLSQSLLECVSKCQQAEGPLWWMSAVFRKRVSLCHFLSVLFFSQPNLRNLRFQLRQCKNRANGLCVFARGKTVFCTFLWG